MDINEFIVKNKEMWKGFQGNEIKGRVLVEKNNEDYLFITHCLGMETLILNKALGYQPIWIRTENTKKIPLELLKSYVPCAEYIDLEPLSEFQKLFCKMYVTMSYLKMLVTGKTLDFYFKGVKYGDVLHDMYLSIYKQGTLQKPKKCLRKIMRMIITAHLQYEKIMKKYNIDATLSSQRVGVNMACLVRSALINGKKAYANCGVHKATLHVSDNKNQLIFYEITPKKEQIEEILNLPLDLFNEEYEKIKNEHIYGNTSGDAKYAFSNSNAYYNSREEFCNKYNLDLNKKNVFIMLHAFNDQPHSHFKKMIFKDYGDWFLKTLDFAKEHDNVNYIFKQHPSDKFYPTEDIVLKDIFAKINNKNIRFLSTDDKVDTRSLEHIADAIITCVGSAGFEIPAFYGIPSITAGDNPYIGYEFSKNPQSKNEYFDILKNLDKVQKLSAEVQKQAQAVYMFIYKYAKVDFKYIPVLSLEDHHDSMINDSIWEKITNIYDNYRYECQDKVARYSFEVSRNDFEALRTKDFVKYDNYVDFPFDVTKPSNNKFDILKDGCQILNKMNIPYFLSENTLSDIYYNHEISSASSIVNVDVIAPVYSDAIIKEFSFAGFKIGKFVSTYGKIQQLMFYKNENVFSIKFYQKVGEKMLNFSEKDSYIIKNAYHYENFDKIEFNNFAFTIPKDIDGFLKNLEIKSYDGESYNIIKETENKAFAKC